MTVCDRCYQPGACCKRMHIQGNGAFSTWASDEPLERQMGRVQAQMQHRGLPFSVLDRIEPPWTDEESGRDYHSWLWSCPKLDQKTGRCTIYDSRPELCRRYEPCSDYLCVHFLPQEAGDPTVRDELPMWPER